MSCWWITAIAVTALALTPARGQGLLFTDPFEAYDRGQCLDLQWQVASGEWRVDSGRLIGRSSERGTCWASASPVSGSQQLSVLLTPVERLAEGGWAGGGLVLWSSAADFWRLAIVESPDGRRYAELVEMCGGKWQAQSEGGTGLEALADGVDGFEWEFDRTYRLTLTIAPERVTGEITDEVSGDLLFRKGHALPSGADAVRQGRAAVMVDAMEVAFDDVRAVGSVEADARTRGPRAAILDTGMPEATTDLLETVWGALSDAGIDCELLRLGDTPGELTVPEQIALLVLPHTRRLPLGVVQAVEKHLRRGGTAIFLGGPFGEDTLVRQGDEWMSLADALASAPTERVFVDFTSESLDTWQRYHGPEDETSESEVEDAGPPGGGKALRVHVDGLRGWDTLARSFDEPPFHEAQTLTCFWAKGGPKTTHLTIEWREKDGSRWMTAVRLSARWKRYVLGPQDFKYWPDSSAAGRGNGDDHFRPENAALFTVGLAQSHSPIPDGPHTYWFADLGSARAPFAAEVAPSPVLEAVSPEYKTHRPTGVREIVAAPDQTIADSGLRLPAPKGIRCAMPRARGLGLKKARIGRWIPVLSARDQKGGHRGVVASIYLSLAEPYPAAAWGVLGIEDAGYLSKHVDDLGPVLAAMARRLLDGVYLARAGADQFSYLPDEAPVLGGQVANRSGAGQELRMSVSVTPDDRGTTMFRESWPISAPPGVLTGESTTWRQAVEPGVYHARTELFRGDELLDVISHEFVRLPKTSAKPSDFVVVRDGDFRLGNRRWHPHGINYWPSNATALEAFSYWLHWLHPSNYDPEVINRDVAALAGLKMNSVSIALRNRDELPAFSHFLYRCAQHGIRANVFVGGGDPMGFNADHVVDLIRAGDLAGNPAIYAWDISWEPHFGAYESRRRLDGEWEEWIVERYGSAENAERDWGLGAPRRRDGAITGPSQEQILNDGDHRVMVAAYRRFLDDLVSHSYGKWARTARGIDPHHLIGVRSGYGGTGQPAIDPRMPFDLVSGAKHLDFTSPEGYGLGGPWENFERGGFTTAYGRYAGGGKPVFWSEFGMSLHPDYSPERVEAQRLLYEHVYRMVTWSGASGSAGWWFPGGFRVGENSDYGIMDPDGSPRPSALEARKWATRMAEHRNFPEPDHWITIDRDLHPRGYSQVWLGHRDEYVEARRAGHSVGLRTEGTGTDSTNTPMVAVGNTTADGANPHKYLNAEFNFVRIRAGGDWIEVAPGDTVDLPPSRRVELAASIGNTGEALWVSPVSAGTKPGGVFLVDAPGSELTVSRPVPGDVPRFGDVLVGPFTLVERIGEDTSVALRLEAKDRTPFGAHFTFALKPTR